MARSLGARALRLALGARRPQTAGRVAVRGLDAEVAIRRDRWGVPYVRAETDHDAFFGQGFCHAQDRGFQLEALLRVTRGTLAELAGPGAVPVDRFSRRVGLHRCAREHLGALPPAARATIEAYAAGINAARACGAVPVPHELALLRSRPSPWSAVDVLAYVHIQALSLNGNWRTELARLRLLADDGPEALLDLDAACRRADTVDAEAARAAALACEALRADVAAAAAWVPVAGGGSNGWAIAGARTASGRPILANDPHLPPAVPGPVHLIHLRTPEWSAAGGSFVGAPGIVIGHNGAGAWGLTAGLADLADLFVEELGPDGRSVIENGEAVPCRVVRERIAVRGGEPVDDEVLITPRGPIVADAPAGHRFALSLRTVWHAHPPVELELRHQRAHDLDAFTAAVTDAATLSLHWVFAEAGGTVGRALGGRPPRRRAGSGVVPRPAWDGAAGWEEELVAPGAMPAAGPGGDGFVMCANERPPGVGEDPFIGVDWADEFRGRRLREVLAARGDWDLAGVRALQMDERTLPWDELRPRLLAVPAAGADARLAQDLLRDWDGVTGAGSAAAAVFELTLAALCRLVTIMRAPRGFRHLLGAAVDPLAPATLLSAARVAHLLRILDDHPGGWAGRSWDGLLEQALATAVERLRDANGPDPAAWAWGRVRPLRLRHPFGERRGMAGAFDLGPFPWGGATHTPSAAAVSVLDPLGNPELVAVTRFSVEAGDWEGARFVLPGGQSGNPCSPHYDDQLALWRRGEGIPIAWSEERIADVTTETLELADGR